MTSVVLDIETVGQDTETFDAIQNEFWFKYAEDAADEERLRESTAFYALTGQIICLALFNPDTHKGKVIAVSDKEMAQSTEQADFVYVADEKALLETFWQDIKHYPQIITFNGRVFDCPFLLLRSAINQIKPTRNLMPNRYKADTHCDLADQLRFYSAVPKAFPLHFYCKAFNIDSPKDGMCGKDVKRYFQAGRIAEIAHYCLQDTIATAKLFDYFRQYLTFNYPY